MRCQVPEKSVIYAINDYSKQASTRKDEPLCFTLRSRSYHLPEFARRPAHALAMGEQIFAHHIFLDAPVVH